MREAAIFMPSEAHRHPEVEMPNFVIAFPVRPGKEEELSKFCNTAMRERKKEFRASEARLGIPKESWFIQETPQGRMVLISFESKDPLKSLGAFGASKDPFDVRFKEKVRETTGVDLNQPPAGPLPKEVLTFER